VGRLRGEDAVSALDRFEPRPSIVIASGTACNCHAYWPLAEPLGRAELERANRRLAHALGADPASADAARILRVPSTFSHKHRPPTAVEALRLDAGRRVVAGDVVGSLPDPPAPRLAPPAPRAQRGDDPLLGIAPDVYVARLLGVEVPRHRKVSCPFHTDRHPSLHVYDTPARGWYCFGRCRRGGTIYDLAAPLYGYTARGEDFLKLRAELHRLFGLEAA
jgi:CHC2-type zinc finger protein